MEAWVVEIESWMLSLEEWGLFFFVLAQVVASLVLLPTWIFAIAAGAVLGVGRGFLLLAPSALLASIVPFLIARYALRERAEKLFKRHRKLKAVDRAVGKQGFKCVVLLRLSPFIPAGIKNYFFGVTDVALWKYVAATFLAKIPGELLLLWLGATGRAAVKEQSPGHWALLAVGVAATLLALWVIGRTAGRQLGLKPG